jgi:hypothetical protein
MRGSSAALILMWVSAPALAQDFAGPSPAWPPGAASVLLERGLPAAALVPTLEAGATRWHGVAALSTRALSVATGWRRLRAGLGVSQTGEPDLGWTALAVALGAAERGGGACLRAVARRDRTSPFGFDASGAAVGGEIGGGAWVEAVTGLHVWASAPQVWTRGAAPPLARPLEIGGAVDLGGVTLWISRRGVMGSPSSARGEREAGLEVARGPCAVWIGARDQPLRGGLGLAARAGALRAAAQVESHPVLGETAYLSLAAGGGR